MSAFSNIDALSTLCTSVPDWNTRLDQLDGQIARRQIELARLEEERPSTRSVRNKGSTESLRPNDGNENNLPSEEVDHHECKPLIESPKPIQDAAPKRPGSSAAARAAAVVTPPPSNNNNNPKASPRAVLTRQSSQPTPPTHPRGAPAVLRKRKTETLASGESVAPKYRTRSMIIVYYDSAVQTAFEELVKFVSGSRNAIRKGKMAAKMAEMRRAAELEVEAKAHEAEESVDDVVIGSGTLLAAEKCVAVGKAGESQSTGGPGLNNAGDLTMPKLRYLSTRDMGPSRDKKASTVGMGLLQGYNRRGGDGTASDIFDELDKGLEWCQSQCEHAAHQFLRDGMCSQEIQIIKRKLDEVKATAQKELARLKKEKAENPPEPVRQAISEKGKSRQLKSVQMRKHLGSMKALEVDDTMEVDDDEGVDDMEPPKLIFKRSRDMGA